MSGKILIVDDDIHVLESLELLLKYEFEKVVTLPDPKKIIEHLVLESYDMILLDMNFKAGANTGEEGFYWLKKILRHDRDAVVIPITAYGDVDIAVRAMKLGATDFIQKPWNSDKLIGTLKTAYKLRQSKIKVRKLEMENRNQTLKEDIDRFYPGFIGESPPVIQVFKIIKKVAVTDANVLILGENGTGKDLVAREIHRQSTRTDENFVSVDLASLSPTLFESELFGHTKGAFTDARSDREGKFETASGGTLFLDEIGNLPHSLQSKILTVLQNREITRIGSNKPIGIDIRLISATNQNLIRLIEENLFRQDLFYRINTVQIELPPLRERGNDLLLLTEYFLIKYSTKYQKQNLRIEQRAMEKLKHYSWPGNVRELQHAIENAVILCESNVLSPDDFSFQTSLSLQQESLKLEDIERVAIEKALVKNNGRYKDTARELGISRTTLYHKLKKYEIQ
ncbi:MAG: AAA family ATPase [Bacteroides sp. SM23_62_1]|nr:MAG: AAA family ATPase [Bacteroides sp. SM23_62_1]